MTEATRSNPKHCAGTRKDGTPCTAPVMGGGEFCFAHAPDRVAERAAARRKGGRGRATAARAEKLVPTVLKPVLVALLQTLQGVRTGALDARRATAVASVARAIVAVYTAGTLEERVQALEAAGRAQEGADGR